jgi:hypothetical protein
VNWVLGEDLLGAKRWELYRLHPAKAVFLSSLHLFSFIDESVVVDTVNLLQNYILHIKMVFFLVV